MHFLVYKDVANNWRWTLFSANGRKVADSSEGYWNRADAIAGMNLVIGTNALTPVRIAT